MYLRIILLATALLIFYRIISFLKKRLPVSAETRHYLTVVLPIAELLTWLGFAVWCIRIMYESEAYAMLITISVLLILMIIPSWYLIRDLIFGILLVIQRKMELNTRIEIGDISGKVVKVGYFTFDVKSKDGNIETIPYSKIQSSIITKSSENINLEKQLVSFTIPATNTLDETVERLRLILLNSPWVAVSQQPIIKNIRHVNGMHEIEVFIFFLKKDYAEKIRDYVSDGLQN